MTRTQIYGFFCAAFLFVPLAYVAASELTKFLG